MTDIHYSTTRDCEFGDRKVEESVEEFVNRGGDIGKLVELLVDSGLLSMRVVFDTFRTYEDRDDDY